MKVSGSAQLDATPEQVWDALLSPEVLVRTIPGCERLEATGENAYAMTVSAGVASIKGTYKGSVELDDLHPHSSLTMRAKGSGAPGTIAVDVAVTFEPADESTTHITYDADAAVGGMIGGVGQRMLTSVSKRMAGEFFKAVNKTLSGEMPAEPPSGSDDVSATAGAGGPAPAEQGPQGQAGMPQVYAQPGIAPKEDGGQFLKGVAVGAAVALVGVAVGSVAARRR